MPHRIGWEWNFPVGRAHETLTLKRERVAPFLLYEGRAHGVSRPEELEDVSLADQTHQAVIPILSRPKVIDITQVAITHRPGVALKLFDHSVISVRVRGEDVAERAYRIALGW